MRWLESSLSLVAVTGAIVVVGVADCHSDGTAASAISAISRDDVKSAFNAAVPGPRMIVFFSSGCAACDTGSAALQRMLQTLDGPMTVLAVWEPIFDTDRPPTPKLLGNINDARVRQLWDPGHIVSDEMRASELAHPGSPSQARTRTSSMPDGIMYDTVAIFPPGSRWETTLPAPEYLEVGLEAILPDVHDRLAKIVGSTSAR